MSRRQKTRRPMAEINVVPYIDVMLVLLVIFMVTAPLLTEGVRVELPQADANPIQEDTQRPIVFAVDRDGHYYVCLLYTSPSPRDDTGSRMPSSA